MLIKLSWGRGWGGEGKEPLSASLLLSPLHPPSHRTSEHSEQPRDLRGGGSLSLLVGGATAPLASETLSAPVLRVKTQPLELCADEEAGGAEGSSVWGEGEG